MQERMENDQISVDQKPQELNPALLYFMNKENVAPPSLEELKNWPLVEEAYDVSFRHIPSKTVPM